MTVLFILNQIQTKMLLEFNYVSMINENNMITIFPQEQYKVVN